MSSLHTRGSNCSVWKDLLIRAFMRSLTGSDHPWDLQRWLIQVVNWQGTHILLPNQFCPLLLLHGSKRKREQRQARWRVEWPRESHDLGCSYLEFSASRVAQHPVKLGYSIIFLHLLCQIPPHPPLLEASNFCCFEITVIVTMWGDILGELNIILDR